ncbi:MAG: hypothetical protein LH613_18785 [Chamaesiphon sp.]|nr:hypothetical protein [Chamaesiphon sp.]
MKTLPINTHRQLLAISNQYRSHRCAVAQIPAAIADSDRIVQSILNLHDPI